MMVQAVLAQVRRNVVAGIKKSVLIDDSYNAAPVSTTEALKLLGRFPGAKKIAVLGDMLELGEDSEAGSKISNHY
jgi:UDP-N-acetylmuramoyl-tripeptide--D-alanyl-D-alanine ligase